MLAVLGCELAVAVVPRFAVAREMRALPPEADHEATLFNELPDCAHLARLILKRVAGMGPGVWRRMGRGVA